MGNEKAMNIKFKVFYISLMVILGSCKGHTQQNLFTTHHYGWLDKPKEYFEAINQFLKQ